ncbi:pentapeptide repeat-containing protein [Leptolyngbya sp. CCNP1308]|uniref:pentapeptide repeat-containing protein n=1 Tax=Leptolyngbya sp. CCNP1308 TaxID=3110255 RepID=UPI002B21B394|nr:pentapeptide repeat-containing protein [Leptolyngbya sp. CCNP1308]MEA5449437.1 pentapeptide repeat-containing protein [Leptolyngbya sp. CCNP1308]
MDMQREELSSEDRLRLIQTLYALPEAQFAQVVFTLDPPSGNVPGSSAAQSDRANKLLEWAKSPIGPGLHSVDEVLSKIIPKASRTAEQALAFVMSGKVNNSTAAELRAFVELLRKKTGDDTIDIAFFKEGSIKALVTGTPEGVAKLQELFEAGELEGLTDLPLQSLSLVDSSSSDARKVRLVQALRHNCDHTSVFDLTRALDHARTRARTFTRTLSRAGAFDLVRALEIALEIAVELPLGFGLELSHAKALEIARDLSRDRARDLSRDRDLALEIARDLSRDREIIRDIDHALLSPHDLRYADLSGANLSYLDLTGADLTGADLTYADVTGTRFGNNQGLSEADRRDLQDRGAIFPPSSDAPSLLRR